MATRAASWGSGQPVPSLNLRWDFGSEGPAQPEAVSHMHAASMHPQTGTEKTPVSVLGNDSGIFPRGISLPEYFTIFALPLPMQAARSPPGWR